MSSPVLNLQKAIVNGQKPLAQLLRETKLIAAKLNLADVEKWVDFELNGYTDDAKLPKYRFFTTTHIEIRNPVRGWGFAGHYAETLGAYQPITEIEILSQQPTALINLSRNLPVTDSIGSGMAANWPQRVIIAGSEFKQILEAVTNELLQWMIELEKRGIKGENMSFDDNEKKSAANQVFHIQKFTGVLGNVTNSQVTVYDYGSIHQLLVDHNVPKDARRELEDIMDELKTATPARKPSLIAKAEKWIVEHKEVLGTSVELVVKAIGVATQQ